MDLSFQAYNITFRRNDEILFSNVSFQLHSGKMQLFTGANGVGKSTLLRILCGLISPNKGEVKFCNASIKNNFHYLTNLAYLGHKTGIKMNLTVLENMRFSDSKKLLQLFELEKYQNSLAMHLSAGQKQRLALINIFLSQAKIWILDEPLTTLDTHAKEIAREYLQNHLQNNGMIIMASHEMLNLPCQTFEIC